MTGNTGYTEFDNSDDADFAALLNSIYEHFDPLVDASVSTVSGLPASGNWPNRTIMATDTKVIYVWSGAAWVDQPKRTVINPSALTGTPGIPVTQCGQIVASTPGSGGTYTLTFPSAFPNGIAGIWMTPLDQASGSMYVVGNSLTKTGANIAVAGHGTAGYRFSWLAIGW